MSQPMNVIPPITDPLGRHWQQPNPSEIEIDDTHALMSQRTFDALLEYSASNPTGVYAGKMWRRHAGDLWLLCWYGESQIGPGYVSNNYRAVLIS
jgi:hypothetical protein